MPRNCSSSSRIVFAADDGRLRASPGYGASHHLDDRRHQLVQERLVLAEQIAFEQGPPQQQADDVALLLVAGRDAFVDRRTCTARTWSAMRRSGAAVLAR